MGTTITGGMPPSCGAMASTQAQPPAATTADTTADTPTTGTTTSTTMAAAGARQLGRPAQAGGMDRTALVRQLVQQARQAGERPTRQDVQRFTRATRDLSDSEVRGLARYLIAAASAPTPAPAPSPAQAPVASSSTPTIGSSGGGSAAPAPAPAPTPAPAPAPAPRPQPRPQPRPTSPTASDHQAALRLAHSIPFI